MKQDPANDRARLQHMLDAAHKSQMFMAGKSRADLDRDEVLALAVTRLLEDYRRGRDSSNYCL